MKHSSFIHLCRRDLLLAFRNRGEIANPLIFFLIVVSLFPLGIDPEKQQLQLIAPGVIWVAALLAAILSLESLFRSDYEDGSLEQMLISTDYLVITIYAKIMVHWLISGLPMIVMGYILATMMFLPDNAMATLMLTLILGTPVLSLIGAIGMALTVGLKRGGLLLSILILPLYIPVLIFATNAVNAAAMGLNVDGQLLILASLLIFTLMLAPLATAASLRISLE